MPHERPAEREDEEKDGAVARHADREPADRPPLIPGDQEGGNGQAEGQSQQHESKRSDAVDGPCNPSCRRADVPSDELDLICPLDRWSGGRVQYRESASNYRSDVGDRERQRVPVAGEERSVYVAQAGAERVDERAAAESSGDGADDERAHGGEPASALEDELVRDALCRQGADGWVAQRCRSPVGELVGVGERSTRVGAEDSEEHRDRSEDDEQAHGAVLRARHAANINGGLYDRG